MDQEGDDPRHTSSSHNSVVSSRRSSAIRVKPRKYGSSASLQPSSADGDKSLTSFPSLSPSPEASPSTTRKNGAGQLPPPSSPRSPIALDQNGGVRNNNKSQQSLVGSLVASPSRQPSRAALFDDTPKDSPGVPGNLHLAEDDQLRKLIAKSGSINMVRQLAGDLAQRDAQMTALRRRAEERERLLRKMLRECEVSNLDIEKRLRELERKDSGKGASRSQSQMEQSRSRRGSNDVGLMPDASINDRLDFAMQESVALEVDGQNGQDEETQNAEDREATIRAKKQTHQGIEGNDLRNSTISTTRDTGRGWKGYLWPGTLGTLQSSRRSSIESNADRDSKPPSRSRAATLTQPRTSVLNDSVFKPPSPTLLRTASSTAAFGRNLSQSENSIKSRSSSNSMTNWATRIFAGTSHARNDMASTVRGRSSGNNDQSNRSSSRTSVITSNSANKTMGSRIVTTKSGTIKGSLAPSRSFRVGSPENKRVTNMALGPASPSSLDNNATNLGPVEMDTILPEDSRPPTLAQLHYNMSDGSEYLTDRFGFIYDQRRKKRQAEAAAALQKDKRNSGVETLGSARDALSIESEDEAVFSQDETGPRPDTPASYQEGLGTKKTKRWQDYLKLASFPTELLAHTPISAPITSIDGAELVEDQTLGGPAKLVVEKRGSMPVLSLNPEPSETHVVSGNAEFAAPARTVDTFSPVDALNHINKQSDPVKSLLQQLTEVHDSLQREKTVRWNDFLRKVRAERRIENEAASNDGRPMNMAMPEVSLTDGEVIGVAGLGNKGKVGRAKWKEFKSLVLGGIPVAYRAKVWAECSGASAARIPGYYDDLVTSGADDPSIVTQIQMDITRTLTDNIYFRRGPGVHKLNEVLVAYSRRNPEVGYCQGMNLITACLLLIMPTAEDAFWLLASMIETILPQGYYDHSLLTSRADQHVLRQYVAELLPKLSGHLDELGIELEALSFQWFLSVFTDCLSAEALFRVWDVVLCINDGSTFLFQVALALLKLNEGALLECESPAGVYHYINHQMTNHAISIDGLIHASEALKKDVRREEVQERRQRAVEQELDFIRQREEAVSDTMRERKKGKRRVSERSADMDGAGNADSGASEDLEVPIRSSRSSSVAPEEAEEGVGMTWRQPMPIDEEAEWRA
ncbi:MAG: hypothetical protein M1822_008153 [Bathelium mastoideum]|nr:MAG: hypothetical protein M1822_008153 [Bathelium mastoideum]